jgi:hypothetical protein
MKEVVTPADPPEDGSALAEAGVQVKKDWIPVFTGMTEGAES